MFYCGCGEHDGEVGGFREGPQFTEYKEKLCTILWMIWDENVNLLSYYYFVVR